MALAIGRPLMHYLYFHTAVVVEQVTSLGFRNCVAGEKVGAPSVVTRLAAN